jgi:hypothetical protein
MNTEQFLSAVLPPEGPYCLQWVERKKSGKKFMKTSWCATLGLMAKTALQENSVGKTVYFRTASYTTPGGTAEGENAAQRMCLHVDIDVGKAGAYASRKDAADALTAVVTALEIPKPLIVSSGGGFHVYWLFDEPVDKTQWQPVATGFRDSLRAAGLLFDYGLSVNVVCLLRPVGTHHRKTETPLPVRAVMQGAKTPFQFFVDKFSANTSAAMPTAPDKSVAAMFELDDSLVMEDDFPPSDADAVANHCAFVGTFRETGFGGGGKQSEWYRALGVVKHCIDGEDTCHAWSAVAENYDHDHCQSKIDQWDKGPTTCQYVADNFDGYCDGCEHNGKVTSPIQLGYTQGEIVAAEVEAKEIDAPWWPRGYGWDEIKGSMYAEKWDAEEGAYRDYFSSTKFYVETRILAEREWQFLVHRRKYVRADGTEVWDSFTVPTGFAARPTDMATEFAKQEVYVAPKTGANNLAETLKAYGDALRMRQIETKLHKAMGWYVEDIDITPDDMAYSPKADGFIIGNRYITPGGEKKVMLSDHIKSTWRGGFGSSGTLVEWARGIHELLVKPGYIPHQFIVLSCFADALVPLTCRSEYHGMVIGISAQSGTGKTTMCRAGLTVWGNPVSLTMGGTPQNGVTSKGLQKNLSGLRHIGPLVDEVTKQQPTVLGELVYAIVMGVPREGLSSDRKPLPVEDPWFSLTKMTSNNPILRMVAGGDTDNEDTGDAIQKRIFDINFERLGYTKEDLTDKNLSAKLQHFIDTQYGTAGPAWVRFLMSRMDDVVHKLETTTQEVRSRSVDGSERFLDYLEASIMVAADLVEEAGLMYPDKAGIKQFIADVREDMMAVRADTKIPMVDAFSRYLSQHHGGILRTNYFPQGRGRAANPETPMNEIRGEIVGRVAIKDRIAAFYVGPLKDWCRVRNIDFNRLLREMDSLGFFVHDPKLLRANQNKPEPMKTATARHSLARDTPLHSTRAHCLMVDFGRITGGAPSLRTVENTEEDNGATNR